MMSGSSLTDRSSAVEGAADVATPLPAPPSRPAAGRRRGGLYVLVFTLGLVVGGGLVLVGTLRVARSTLQNPDRWPDLAVRRIDLGVDLDETQQARVNRIVRRRLAAIEAIRAEVYPEIGAELDGLADEVEEVLRPGSQRRRWRQIVENFRRNVRPPPPPPSADEAEPSDAP